MNESKDFKPYIPAEKITPELTATSIITGIILAVVFGAANAYLGLRVGMTVSASIPAAVTAMGIIRIILKRNSILESNIVQTIGSAGESLAAGAIFTLPALFLWAAEGKTETPSMMEITLIALLGGLLGILFMVPLRNALIVREHGILPYPEGTACAEVLLAGENKSSNASTVFAGMGIAGIFKFIIDGLKAVPSEVSFHIKSYAGEFGTQIYPAVLSVGYICGPKISSYMLAGGVLAWMAIIPAIVLFGSNLTLYPGTAPIGELFATGGASAIWNTYIRYIGAGALAAGGVISLIKSLPLIIKTFRDTVKGLKGNTAASTNTKERTSLDLNYSFILIAILIITLLIWLIPTIPVSFIGALLIVIFGFFFSTVSSRMVGLVGSSNNPVSGMAIATLLISTIILKFSGNTGISGMIGAIAIGSVICIVAAIAGDTSQDLKTGYILGSTPKKQQIGELIGVTFSALAIGGVLYLLNAAWGFGGEELGAPQATLMKIIIEGVMESNLPWELVFIGVFLAITIEIIGIPVLPFAIGVYLPIHLNMCIMFGGLVRLMLNKIKTKTKEEENEKEKTISSGLLFCSGMIAGEGIVGILLALFALLGIEKIFDISNILNFSPAVSSISGIVVLGLIILSLLKFTIWKTNKNK